MTEKEFTFLELHLHDVDFSPTNTAPFFSRGEEATDEDSGEAAIDVRSDDESETGTEAEETTDEDSGSRFLRFVMLVLLFAIASAAAKKFGGDDEFEDLAEFDEESEAEA